MPQKYIIMPERLIICAWLWNAWRSNNLRLKLDKPSINKLFATFSHVCLTKLYTFTFMCLTKLHTLTFLTQFASNENDSLKNQIMRYDTSKRSIMCIYLVICSPFIQTLNISNPHAEHLELHVSSVIGFAFIFSNVRF